MKLLRGCTHHVAQQVIRFRDRLHDPVLDAVVDHLDIVPRPARPDIGHAGIAVHLCRDRFQRGRDQFIGRPLPAGHDRRTTQRALLTARNTAADKEQAVLLQGHRPAFRLRKMAVAEIDQQITLIQKRLKVCNGVIYRAGRNEQDHAARHLQRIQQRRN